MKSTVHDHYITCECGAQFSNPIPSCPACKKPNPELAPTLNAKTPEEKTDAKPEAPPTLPSAKGPSTLNGKDE